MFAKIVLPILLLLTFFCNNNQSTASENAAKNITTQQPQAIENPYRFINEIPLPDGFKRLIADKRSFAYWLQQVPLKKDKRVFIYNGVIKQNQSAQFAVLNISVGDKNLQQCADAVMRLRAEYLFEHKRYAEITFADNAGKQYQFTQPYNLQHFGSYLQLVFGMCGSASLAKQLTKKQLETIEAGDVLIRGGFPGHAVIVMDAAVNTNGKRIYLLAQSYMPAQDIHVLINADNPDLSPWYEVNDKELIPTPEYTFTRHELKRW